jgi:hypothetical protein
MKCPRPDYTHNGQRVQIEGWTLPKNEYVPPSVRRALWLFMEYRVVRWIIWPDKAGSVTGLGNTQDGQGAAETGNTSVTKAGNKSVPEAGDTLKKKTKRTSRKAGADGHQQFVKWFCIVDAAELYRQIGHNGIALLEQCVNRYKVELLLWNAPGGLRFTLERWDPCPKTT